MQGETKNVDLVKDFFDESWEFTKKERLAKLAETQRLATRKEEERLAKVAEAERQAAEKEAQQQAELKRAKQQRRWALAVVVLTTSLAGWAWNERSNAQKETARANAAEKLAINQSFEEDMVKIPAGKFVMGCQDGRDSDCGDDEKPAHSVDVPSFAMSKYEVTQGQWAVIMGSNPSVFKDCGNNCPVENVSWDDIQTFIQKLNAKTGQHYRLPSEAEWEYACRAGKDSQYCGGNKLDDIAWHDGNSGNFLGKNQQPHPVAQKQANAFGLYDMSGNVWEWVQDGYHDNYTGAPTDGKAWQDGASARVVLRGGSWFITSQYLRSANRGNCVPSGRNDIRGFRLARTLP